MKVSTRGRYGLRAMSEMALGIEDSPLSLKTIAQSQGIPEQYLEQIMITLRKAGLVVGIRGPLGGYSLAKPPEDIFVGDILRALEGSIGFVGCAMDGEKDPCDRAEICITRPLWEKLTISIIKIVDSMSLSELCQQKPLNGSDIN